MFNGLYYCNSHDGKVCSDYHADGVYFTFVFCDGRLYEHNEERDRIAREAAQ